MESVEIFAVALALLAQFAAIIWGASKLSANLIALKESVDKLAITAEHLDSRVDAHEIRITIHDKEIMSLQAVLNS